LGDKPTTPMEYPMIETALDPDDGSSADLVLEMKQRE
jgi:hypothetical protein